MEAVPTQPLEEVGPVLEVNKGDNPNQDDVNSILALEDISPRVLGANSKEAGVESHDNDSAALDNVYADISIRLA